MGAWRPMHDRLGVWREDHLTGEAIWSDGLYQIMGLEADHEPSIDDYRAMVIADDRERLKEYEEAVAAGEEPVPVKLRLIHPDGGIRHILYVIEVSPGEDGDIEERLGVFVDVTDQLELAESARRQVSDLSSQLLTLGRGELVASPSTDTLPVEEPPAPTETAATRTVLIVDDLPRVRRIAALGFEHLGYRVQHAADLAEARRRIEELPDLALIFSDVVLPDGRGPELLSFLTELGRSTACLFTSGYSEDELVRQGVLHDGVSLLNKPYTQERLAEAVDQVIAGRRFLD